MKLTVSMDEHIIEGARNAAQKMGKSLDQAVQDHLQQLVETSRREEECARLEVNALASEGRLNGWRFNREEANER